MSSFERQRFPVPSSCGARAYHSARRGRRVRNGYGVVPEATQWTGICIPRSQWPGM